MLIEIPRSMQHLKGTCLGGGRGGHPLGWQQHACIVAHSTARTAFLVLLALLPACQWNALEVLCWACQCAP